MEFLTGLLDFGISIGANLFGFVVGTLFTLLIDLLGFLPELSIEGITSGFADFGAAVASFNVGLGWLNWFVPMGGIAAVLAAWAVAEIAAAAVRAWRWVKEMNVAS